ncbi:MAG: HEPN domain-containing protein [Candidatus Sulfotelmatobacter sp.]
MLNSEEEARRVKEHLRLAKGFLDSAVVDLESSEFEVRNALSRSYYAMLHACNALVLSCGMEPSKSHGGLRTQVQRLLGKPFGRLVGDLYELRRVADYDAGWTANRQVIDAKLKVARTNILWAYAEARRA